MKTLISIGLYMIGFSAFSQEWDVNYSALNSVAGGIYVSSDKLSQSNVEIVGNTHLFSDWKDADLIFKDSDSEFRYPVKFDLESNSLEVSVMNREFVIPWKNLEEVRISKDNRSFFFHKELEVLLETLYVGKYSLYRKHFLKIRRKDFNPTLNTGNKYDQWVISDEFYLQTVDGLYPIRKRKDLIDALRDKEPDLKKTLKELDFELNEVNTISLLKELSSS